MDPIRLSLQNLDARSIDYTSQVVTPSQTYAQAVSADSPWLYWYLNDPSGTFVDYGVANPGPTNHPGIQAGTISRNVSPGLTGDGRTCIISAGGVPSPGGVYFDGLGHGGAPQTFEVLVQQTTFPPIGDVIFAMRRDGVGGSTYFLYGGCGTEDVQFQANLAGIGNVNLDWSMTTNAFTDGKVHQVTLTYAAAGGGNTNLELFIDAVSQGVKFLGGGQQLVMDEFVVGTDSTGAYSFAGKLQDAHIYQYILTQPQILAHYNAITVP